MIQRWALLAAVLLPGGAAVSAGEQVSPPPYEVKASSLPQGNNGIAARYPGDGGISKDPAVVFHDDFETGDLSKWVPNWKFDRARVTEKVVHGGRHALQWAVTLKEGEGDIGGNSMGVKLEAGLDLCFYRVYCKLPEDFAVRAMHGWSITATAPGVSALGGAGQRPNGKDKFTLTIDNMVENISLYTYHPEQPKWGTSHRTGFSMEKGKWQSIELMLKANEPGKRDGEIAVWLDGKLLSHWAGFRYRDVPELAISMIHLVFYFGQNKGNPPGYHTMFHDDVVVAKSYIGPMVQKKGK